MTTFDWTTFTRRIAVKAKLSDIYDAWTKAIELERWFLSNAVFIDKNNNVIEKETLVKNGFSYKWN